MAMSTLTGITASTTVRSCLRYLESSASTSWMTVLLCPCVAVRTMPGRSMMVRSGMSGASTLTWMYLSWQMPLLSSPPPPPPQSVSVSSLMRSAMPALLCTVKTALESVLSLASIVADHSWPRDIDSWVAHLVTSPVPRGKGMPLSASSTLDFPDDWSPITAICGIGTSFWTPILRRSSTRSIKGRTLELRASLRSAGAAAGEVAIRGGQPEAERIPEIGLFARRAVRTPPPPHQPQ